MKLLNEILLTKAPGLEEAGIWHITKVILNCDHFKQEPSVTPAMGIDSRNCQYCKKMQERSGGTKVFCGRHLMLYELRKFHVREETPVFKYKDIYLFSQKYAIKWFENVIVGSFSARSINKNDVYYLLKFSFLLRDIQPVNFKDVVDLTFLDNEDELQIDLAEASLVIKNDRKGGFTLKTFTSHVGE